MNTIKVGDNSIIGEDCVVHVSSGVTETARPTNIGNDVIVGEQKKRTKKNFFVVKVAT